MIIFVGAPLRGRPFCNRTFDEGVATECHPYSCVFCAPLVTIPRPLTLTHSTVTGMLIQQFQNRNNATRAIGLLLLVLILYGTTVEAAHRHGRVLPDTQAPSLVDSNQTNSPVSTKSGCNDCLICQLHQNFSATLVTFRLVDPPKHVRVKVPPAASSDVLSQITGPSAGRAPPAIS
jgi:hypothetical protein